MCLGVPGKIITIEGETAEVSIGGTIVKAGLHLIENACIGDYVLIHTGFALQKIDEEEAKRTLEMLDDADQL